MIFLFTDFGDRGPYVGQVLAVLAEGLPGTAVVNLMSDAPQFNPRASAYLLSALAPFCPEESLIVAVVDPGVGSSRHALLVEAGGRRFIGPDNGLLAVVAGRDASASAWRIDWRPQRLSASFHGRDLFAPAAVRLGSGRPLASTPVRLSSLIGYDWPAEVAEVIYVDGYGNCMTGLMAARLSAGTRLRVSGKLLRRARSFSDVTPGSAFWYENALGLAEIAVNCGTAAEHLRLDVGSAVGLESGEVDE